MATYAEKIAQLTDQQALSIVDSLAGEFATMEMPEGKEDQTEALQTLFAMEEETLDMAAVAASSTDTAADAARQLLSMMALVPEIKPSLDEWLDNPPTQEAAAIPLILAAPVVLAGSIAFLNIVGHVRFKRHRDGTWEIDYNPSKQTPLDNTMEQTIKAMADLMRLMVP